MEKRKKIIYSIFASMVCFGSFLFVRQNIAVAGDLNTVVVNEVQISGETANDEFIELHNPTTEEIDLEGWDIKKKTKTGTIGNIVTDITGIIPASGYFLITPRANCGEAKNESCYKGKAATDGFYSTNNFLAKDNSLLIFDKDNNLVDLAGWGEAADFEGEVFSINPEDGQSLERKREEGICRDSGNNKNDFIVQNSPNPQNSKTSAETVRDDGNSGPEENNNNANQADNMDENISQESGNSSAQQSNAFSKMMITEFLPNPEDSDRDNEFIEIYNGGDKDENLGRWAIEDKSGKTTAFTIPEKTIVKAGAYKEFYSDETNISLNNAGDGVILKNAQGIIISETPLCDTAEEDVSFAIDENNVWKWTKSPTPGRENIIVYDEPKIKEISKEPEAEKAKNEEALSEASEEYDFSDGMMITEIFPNPAGMDNEFNYEWIEIYNNGNGDINLRGWQIDDILKKGSKIYVIEEDRIIKRGASLIFSNEETKVIFNNTGDEASLLWPDGTVVDSVQYAKSKEGFSYAIAEDGKWHWTSVLTPGKKNILKSDNENSANLVEEKTKEESAIEAIGESESAQEIEDEKIVENKEIVYTETDVESAKKMRRFSTVKVSGIVSTPPGVFSDNSFYVSGSGMQIYSYTTKFSGINIGDKIEAMGSISEVGGEKRLLIESSGDIKVLSHDNLLEPKMISTGDVGENFEGCLIIIEGKVSNIRDDVFYVDDGSGEVKIYIKPQTGIAKPEIKINDPVVVTGEVSRTSLGYRILPRFQADIRTSRISSISTEENSSQDSSRKEEAPSGRKSGNIPIYDYIFAVAGLLVLMDWGRMKIKK